MLKKSQLSILIVFSLMLTTSAFAGGSGGRSPGGGGGGRGPGGGYSHGGGGGHYAGGWSHGGWGRYNYGYYGRYGYYGAAPFWTDFGLNAAGLVIGAAAIYNQPDVVYVNETPQIVVQQAPAPQVIVQQPAPQQVIYQQAPAPQVIVQQPAPQQTIYQQQPVPEQQIVRVPNTNVPKRQTVQSEPSEPSEPKGERQTLEEYKIYLPVGNGTFIMVPLMKTLTGFIGPQGEFYPDHPTIEQLNERYMKR